MDRIHNIVVGVDFSDSSLRAFEQSLRIAAWSGASLHVFHVITTQRAAYMPTDSGVRLGELEGPPWANDLATREVVVGHPLAETLRLVKERSADLLVIGAFGPLGQFTGNGVGTFAAQCMRHVPCKVLAVHEDLRGSFKRVLAATDFSVSADRALEAAVRLVRQEAGELHVIHVPDSDTADAGAIEKRLRDTVQRLDHGDPPLPVRYVVTSPREPGHEIIRYARKIEAHVIALGRHGIADLEYVLIGNTCEQVLRAVRRSVLVGAR